MGWTRLYFGYDLVSAFFVPFLIEYQFGLLITAIFSAASYSCFDALKISSLDEFLLCCS